jgi:hypothetical protein
MKPVNKLKLLDFVHIICSVIFGSVAILSFLVYAPYAVLLPVLFIVGSGTLGLITVFSIYNGTSSYAVERRSYQISAAIPVALVLLFYPVIQQDTVDLTGLFGIFVTLLSGIAGGFAGHIWHERWESLHGTHLRPFDLGLIGVSPELFRKAQSDHEIKINKK